MRARKSSMVSKTTALPRWLHSSGLAALGFITAPPGARLPRSTQMPLSGFTGASTLRMTSALNTSAVSYCSPIVRPETVRASGFRNGAICFITAGRPPA